MAKKTKIRLLGPEKNQHEPPQGLKTDSNFKRIGLTNAYVIQDEKDKNKITLFPRLIYQDNHGLNSCIIKLRGLLEGPSVKILPEEQTIFQAQEPFGTRGVEDFRAVKLAGEDPLHGFLVYFNGFESRTGYVRTSEKNPRDYSKWDEFGIYFPNISMEEAISLVKNPKYKKRWMKDYKETIKKTKNPFLGTKDCCLYPKKMKRKDKTGKSHEFYAVIIRLLPDIQIVYIKGFEQLASHGFWQKTIENLDDHLLLGRENSWEKSHIGLADPAIELSSGILIPYHGAVMHPKRNYKFGFALVDKDNPQKVLARTKKPFLKATEPWEKDGIVPGNIIFPEGHAISEEGKIYSFYGAADKYLAYTTTTEAKILEYLVAK